MLSGPAGDARRHERGRGSPPPPRCARRRGRVRHAHRRPGRPLLPDRVVDPRQRGRRRRCVAGGVRHRLARAAPPARLRRVRRLAQPDRRQRGADVAPKTQATARGAGRADGRRSSTVFEPAYATRAPSEIDAVADNDALGRAFASLRPKERAILTLHHVDERPVAEIARTLGIPEGTAKWRLHAARQALEKAMEVEA